MAQIFETVEFDETTVFLLQKILPTRGGQQATVICGYTTDQDWAERWRSRASEANPRFVVPVKKMEGAP